jgi:hypothetical protein
MVIPVDQLRRRRHISWINQSRRHVDELIGRCNQDQ